MWEAKLKQQRYRTLRFNARESDHTDDPFAALFSEFRLLAKAQEDVTEDTLDPLFARLKDKALPILKKSAVGMIKHLTMGAVDAPELLKTIMADVAEEAAKQVLEKAESDKQSLQAFRDELAEFVQKSETTGQPVVYFIDELDRCRPTYAIAVLERVKHLLNVPGVVFVFAWDRKQLNETIKHVYGRQTDSGGYLLRFVDLEFSLSITNHRFFCNTLMERFGFLEHIEKKGGSISANSIADTFPKIAENLNLSIREQEKAFTALSVIIRTNSQMDSNFLEILVTLIMLRIKKPSLYQSICSLTKSPSKALNTLRQLVGTNLPSALGRHYWESDQGGQLEGCLLHLLPDNLRVSMPAEYTQITQRQPQIVLTKREEKLKDAYLVSIANNGVGGILAYFIKKLEFSAQFLS